MTNVIIHVPEVNGYSETEAIMAVIKILEDDTRDHNWACHCKRCNAFRKCVNADMVRYDD